MKETLAIAGVLAFTITPTASFAHHLEPKESELRPGGNLEHVSLFSPKYQPDKMPTFDPEDPFDIATIYSEGYGIDLSGANLDGARMGGNLRNANLSRASLYGANLKWIDLSNANLVETNLSRVLLNGANLSGANLRFANLWGAHMPAINLAGADLSGANLNHVDLSGMIRRNDGSTNGIPTFSTENHVGSNLIGANLSNVSLSFANLQGVDLSNTILTGIDATNLKSCPSLLPMGWFCENNSLIQR